MPQLTDVAESPLPTGASLMSVQCASFDGGVPAMALENRLFCSPESSTMTWVQIKASV